MSVFFYLLHTVLLFLPHRCFRTFTISFTISFDSSIVHSKFLAYMLSSIRSINLSIKYHSYHTPTAPTAPSNSETPFKSSFRYFHFLWKTPTTTVTATTTPIIQYNRNSILVTPLKLLSKSTHIHLLIQLL